MTGLYLLVANILAIVVSFLLARAGAIALMMIGLPQEKARFQPLSPFTRAGFTTKEAELAMNHPQRRRIVTWLIMLGNAGLVTVVVTATSSIATSRGYQPPITITAILAGALVLFMLVSRSSFGRRWERFVESRLVESPLFEEEATEELLHPLEGYGLVRVTVTEDSSVVGQSLGEANTTDNEFWVAGIGRGKDWISLPRSREVIKEGNRLVVYGNLDSSKSAFKYSKMVKCLV